jgi:hypothetical protein
MKHFTISQRLIKIITVVIYCTYAYNTDGSLYASLSIIIVFSHTPPDTKIQILVLVEQIISYVSQYTIIP